MSSAFAHPAVSRERVSPRDTFVAVLASNAACRGLAAALLAGPVCRWAGTASECDVSELALACPDAVVLVADFASSGGMTMLRRVRAQLSAAPLVVVARENRSGIAARQALNAGAEAFVPAEAADEALVPALDAVMAGLVCAPRAARRVVAKPTFSHREKEVLELLVAGLTNRQIGTRLYLAESTVKTHLASAFAKLGVRSRKDAVALLLDPAEGLATTALPPAAPTSPC
jgi:DNA-binding NarL/FixJ family response regulator